MRSAFLWLSVAMPKASNSQSFVQLHLVVHALSFFFLDELVHTFSQRCTRLLLNHFSFCIHGNKWICTGFLSRHLLFRFVNGLNNDKFHTWHFLRPSDRKRKSIDLQENWAFSFKFSISKHFFFGELLFEMNNLFFLQNMHFCQLLQQIILNSRRIYFEKSRKEFIKLSLKRSFYLLCCSNISLILSRQLDTQASSSIIECVLTPWRT